MSACASAAPRVAVTTLLLAALAAMPRGAAAQELPAGMRGTWADTIADCTDPGSDGRIAVRAREVEFFASLCRFRTMRALDGGVWRGAATCVESDQSDEQTLELRLAPPGRISIRSGTDAPRLYVRCPRDVPVR
jgi:hypothetical protein